MTQPGYQEGSEPRWWWEVARHLDEAQIALASAMAHNLDDQSAVFALQDKLREGQGILLGIFQAKGLAPLTAVARPGGAEDADPGDRPSEETQGQGAAAKSEV